MRVFKTRHMLIALLASLALAACSSTPSDQNATQQTQTQASTANSQPVNQGQPTQVETQQNSAPVSADNYWNNPANYDGTTNTRIIYFSFDASSIPSASFDTLRAHAAYLKAHTDAKVRLEGNTDERGTREYNIALGERRAKAVAQFLEVQGVSASQIQLVSYGEEKPADPAHNEMAWAKNRRVVIDYLAGQP
jgi:peptidoglycan-associated lipoprotein